jgi:hypothetical protein
MLWTVCKRLVMQLFELTVMIRAIVCVNPKNFLPNLVLLFPFSS